MKKLYKCYSYGIKFISKSLVILYDKMGLRYIWETFHPPINDKSKRPPSVFVLRLVSAHLILFGLALAYYELHLSRLQSRIDFLMYQADTENWKSIISEVPKLQNTKLPYLPSITNPFSSIFSLFLPPDKLDLQTVKTLQNLIYRKRSDLSDVNLENLILGVEPEMVTYELNGETCFEYIITPRHFSYSNFKLSNLKHAFLKNNVFSWSNFENAQLVNSSMQGCELLYVNFEGARLSYADLKNANLVGSNMRNAFLRKANLEKANLCGVDLTGCIDINHANFDGAIYNSGKLDFYLVPTREEIKVFLSDKCLDSSLIVIDRLYSAFLTCVTVSPDAPTSFSDGFLPVHHGMIDLYEMMKFAESERSKK